jgi:hypothetical protein
VFAMMLKGEAIELYSTVPVYPRFSFLTIQMEPSKSNCYRIMIALITCAQVKPCVSRPAWPSKLPKGPEIKELIGVFQTATPN